MFPVWQAECNEWILTAKMLLAELTGEPFPETVSSADIPATLPKVAEEGEDAAAKPAAIPEVRMGIFIPPATKLGGVYWIHPVCLSVRLSVCPSVCPLTFRVRPVASTVQDGFFPYLVQMINSMRGCVACDDLWPWLISSRSSDLDLEYRVRSVASTVLDGFFLYLAQMITIIRGCVACYIFFKIWKFEFLAI